MAEISPAAQTRCTGNYAEAINMFRMLLRHLRPQGDCLVWTGARWENGYGRVYIAGEDCRVHRLMWELTNGDIPEGMLVCHTCDNPPCCNPDHLFIGTFKDNSADRDKKLRHYHGEDVNTNKLTEDQVIEIRLLWESSPRKYGLLSALGREYGVSHIQIRNIITGKSWKHLW